MVKQEKLSAVLIELAHTLVTDPPVQGILDRLVVSVVDVLDVTAAGATLLSAGGAPHHVAASSAAVLEVEERQTRRGQGPCVTAHDTGEPVAVPDLVEDVAYAEFGQVARAAGMAAAFTLPLRHGEVRLGALTLYQDTAGPLDPWDVSAARTLADVAAAYLLNAQALQDARDVSDRFRHSASHDALTGLPNRLLLEQRLEHAARRGRRSHGTAAVLFADIDQFKAVNDTHGQFVGDALLVAVAHRLSGVLRPGDTLARLSGDEFVILCEDLADAADAQLLATRIQASLAEPFRLRSLTVRVTASVGIAFAGPGEMITDQLVRDADMAMYEAKRTGGASHRTFDARVGRGGAPWIGEDDLDPPRSRAAAGAR